jgi:hypothetical protein
MGNNLGFSKSIKFVQSVDKMGSFAITGDNNQASSLHGNTQTGYLDDLRFLRKAGRKMNYARAIHFPAGAFYC